MASTHNSAPCTEPRCPLTHNIYMLYTLSLSFPPHMQTQTLPVTYCKHRHTHSHEGRLGLQHAGPQGDVIVVEGDYAESDGLGHSQHNGQQPDPHDLHCGNRGNTGALHS